MREAQLPIDPDTADTGEAWIEVGALDAIPRLGARVVRAPEGDIAVFRTADDKVFALRDHCPHKGGPLSQGIVYGDKVACPLHNWSIHLDSGEAVAPDTGCTATYATKVTNGRIYLALGVKPMRRSGSDGALAQDL